jgi:ribonuclease PH
MVRVRIDGRGNDEMRPVEMVLGYQEFAEGSVLITVGRTRVLCSATVEDCVPPWVGGHDRGWVAANYAMLPRATRERTPRKSTAREVEISQLVGRALRAAVDLDALGRRTIDVDCDVIQADGGTRTAAITGGYVALAQALEHLVQRNQVYGQVRRAPVAAISVALLGGEMLLDPCHEEDVRAEVDCDVVGSAYGRLVEVHAPAARPYSREQLDALLDLAVPGIAQLLEVQAELLVPSDADHGLAIST